MLALRDIIAILGFLMVTMMLWDAFEVIILPRRVTRRFRFARAFYRSSWRLWSAFVPLMPNQKRRETYLSGAA